MDLLELEKSWYIMILKESLVKLTLALLQRRLSGMWSLMKILVLSSQYWECPFWGNRENLDNISLRQTPPNDGYKWWYVLLFVRCSDRIWRLSLWHLPTLGFFGTVRHHRQWRDAHFASPCYHYKDKSGRRGPVEMKRTPTTIIQHRLVLFFCSSFHFVLLLTVHLDLENYLRRPMVATTCPQQHSATVITTTGAQRSTAIRYVLYILFLRWFTF